MQVCMNWTAFVLLWCFLKQGVSFILLYLTILSFFSTYGYQINTTQIYFFSCAYSPQNTSASLQQPVVVSLLSCHLLYIQTLLEQSSQHTEHSTSEELLSARLDSSATFWILSVCLAPRPAPGSKQVLEGPFQKLVFVFTSRRHAVEHSSQSSMGSRMTVLLLRFSSQADAHTLCFGTSHLRPGMPSIIQILTNQALGTAGTRYSNQIKAAVNTHCFISTTLENIMLIIETVNKTMIFVQ